MHGTWFTTSARDVDLAASVVDGHDGGLVVVGDDGLPRETALRRAGFRGGLVVDRGVWRRASATPGHCVSNDSGQREDGELPLDLPGWKTAGRDAGADAVLSPSLFVEADDWASLRALVTAVAREELAIPFVPTASSMLEPPRLPLFLAALDDALGRRPAAFTFTGRNAFRSFAALAVRVKTHKPR